MKSLKDTLVEYDWFAGWKRFDGFEFHSLLTMVVVPVSLIWLAPWQAFLLNTAGWFVYEGIQGLATGKGMNPFSDRWGWRKRLELIAPELTGAIITAIAACIIYL